MSNGRIREAVTTLLNGGSFNLAVGGKDLQYKKGGRGEQNGEGTIRKKGCMKRKKNGSRLYQSSKVYVERKKKKGGTESTIARKKAKYRY